MEYFVVSYTDFTRSYVPQALSTSVVSLTATGITNIVNETEAGVLNEIGIAINTVVLASATANLEIQIDGGSTISSPIFAGAATLSAAWKAVPGSGTSAVGDFRVISFHVPYLTSVRVGINVTGAAGVTGELQVTVTRSKRI